MDAELSLNYKKPHDDLLPNLNGKRAFNQALTLAAAPVSTINLSDLKPSKSGCMPPDLNVTAYNERPTPGIQRISSVVCVIFGYDRIQIRQECLQGADFRGSRQSFRGIQEDELAGTTEGGRLADRSRIRVRP
jgi:hypothetical protein